MQKIQKFQFGRLYVAPKSTKTYELLDRDGHRLVFRVRKPKDRTTDKIIGISTYKADEKGAFEEILFSNGVRLRSDSLLVDRKKLKRVEQIPQQGIIDLMAILAA